MHYNHFLVRSSCLKWCRVNLMLIANFLSSSTMTYEVVNRSLSRQCPEMVLYSSVLVFLIVLLIYLIIKKKPGLFGSHSGSTRAPWSCGPRPWHNHQSGYHNEPPQIWCILKHRNRVWRPILWHHRQMDPKFLILRGRWGMWTWYVDLKMKYSLTGSSAKFISFWRLFLDAIVAG